MSGTGEPLEAASVERLEADAKCKPMNKFTVTILAFSLTICSAAWSSTGEVVDVRVVSAATDQVYVESPVATGDRLEVEVGPDRTRFLGLERNHFQEQQVIKVSVADGPGIWVRSGYGSWDEPGEVVTGDLRIQLVPPGWADRYCRAVGGVTTPGRPETRVSVYAGGTRFRSDPEWRGSGVVDLTAVAQPDAEPWQARLDGGGRLQIRRRPLESWHTVDLPRDDFRMIRYTTHATGRLKVVYEPPAYARRFCERLSERGMDYAEEIVDHLFGRD